MVEATEIVFLLLKEGQNPEDTGSQAAQTLKTASTTLSQQPGFVRSFWVSPTRLHLHGAKP